MTNPILNPLTHAEIRGAFHDMVCRELLGPCHGPEEELDEKVSWRYLVGWLAPRNTAPAKDDVDEGPLDTPGEEDTGEEGAADDPLLRSASMLPNSFGFTFCVAEGVPRLRVRAEWGWYRRRPSETGFLTQTGNPKTVWFRTPVVRETLLAVEPGELQPWIPEEEVPEVQVTGSVLARADGTRLVTLFLVNGQAGGEGNDARWLFQAGLRVESVDGSACFAVRAPRIVEEALDPADRQAAEETRMVYRDAVEFAVGHGTAVDWAPGDTPDCATAVWTTAMPAFEVPRSRPAPISGLETRMAALGAAGQADLLGILSPLVSEYRAWTERQHGRVARREDRLAAHQEAAARVLERATEAADRIQAGIDLLAADPVAFQAFRFTNRAMHLQRLHSLLSHQIRRGEKVTLADVEAAESPAWYPFQLAFILLNLPSLTRLDHPERSGADAPDHAEPVAELLWFPTGGGKTEAYLGLTAYTLALRRLQGDVEGRAGSEGVGVLMRYTLRLLTLQQFQRATTLICACEALRREDTTTWGRTPFRIGLWLGRASTPNTFDRAQALLDPQDGAFGGGVGAAGTLHQLTNCPWCGQPIRPRDDIKADAERRRILTYCGDSMGRCDFSRSRSPEEGLPVCIVDEDVYRLLPGLVIATVDKFAQMPWNGEVQMLAGKVSRRCGRHGFLCPNSTHDAESHRATHALSAARVEPHPGVRPPDLIIQDELHLITGPLGSMVGIYETAVDDLCSWTVDGRRVRPKLVVSTATIQRARDQVNDLFRRDLRIFPPRALDAADSFFALQEPVSPGSPGLRYVGVCATGRRLKAALIRVYVACLCAAQTLFDEHGETADPYMTLVGYFNSIRELGGMRRLIDDDIRSRVYRMDKRGLAKRSLRTDDYDELTSRKSAADIPRILDRLERTFGAGAGRPYDALIATNMISVGVDVPRLGLMVVAGQPKLTAEYIQATSRVGRRYPGIVFTVMNWARPRDLSHYERFRHYHATFHAHVEATSVTPFSPGARERALSAVLVSLARLSSPDCNAEDGAQEVLNHPELLAAAKAAIRDRVENVVSADLAPEVAQEAQSRIDAWLHKATAAQGGAGTLVYHRTRHDHDRPLLRHAEDGPWQRFTCPDSLREVEATSNLVLLEQVDEAADKDAAAGSEGVP